MARYSGVDLYEALIRHFHARPSGPKMLAVASKNPKQKIVALNLSCVCLGDRSQAVGDVGEFQSGGWGQIARKLAGDP